MPAKKKAVDFEASLQRLESLVKEMEQGDLPIEEALKAFEEGIGLTRECQAMLDSAEQKVQVLIENRGEVQARDLQTDDTP